jgi:ankyrin repeat protein
MHPWRLSVLYAAAGRANHAGLTMMLLEAGANPNDNESLYHSAEFNDHTCTKLLLDYGAKIEGTNAVHRKLDYDDLAGLRLFLDRGADPNLGNCSGDGLIHWAITNGRRVPFLALLAERGANLRARNREGLTPFQQASRLGHTSAAKFLLRRRAGKRLTPREEFIAACSRGDRRRVKAILAKRPGTIASLTEADRGLLPSLAWRGKGKAVKVMLEAGFDVTAKGKDGETALHCAAWMGHSGIAEILIADGAPLECLEPKYNATPMEWALHGSVNSRDAIGNPLARHADHAGVVRALLNAGARPPASVDDNVPKAVKAVLLRH